MVIGTKNKGTVTFDKEKIDKLSKDLDYVIDDLIMTMNNLYECGNSITESPLTARGYCDQSRNYLEVVVRHIETIKSHLKDV